MQKVQDFKGVREGDDSNVATSVNIGVDVSWSRPNLYVIPK